MLHHIEGDGAMGEEQVSRFVVDARRIGLESARARQHLRYHHRKHGWHIAFATCHDAFGVESGQCHAACVVNSAEEVETTQRETLELMAFDKGLQGQVNLMSAGQSLTNGKFLVGLGVG